MTIRSPAKLGALSHRSLPRPQSPQIGPECGSNPGRACQTRAQDDVVHVAAPACGCSANHLNISSREDRCFFSVAIGTPRTPSDTTSPIINISRHAVRRTVPEPSLSDATPTRRPQGGRTLLPQHAAVEFVFRQGSRIASTHASSYMLGKNPHFPATPGSHEKYSCIHALDERCTFCVFRQLRE